MYKFRVKMYGARTDVTINAEEFQVDLSTYVFYDEDLKRVAAFPIESVESVIKVGVQDV